MILESRLKTNSKANFLSINKNKKRKFLTAFKKPGIGDLFTFTNQYLETIFVP